MSGKEGPSNDTMDPSNPLYVHHLDQPGHMLLLTKLNGDNYQSWKTTMVHALTTNKKLEFVDDTLEMSSREKHPSHFKLFHDSFVVKSLLLEFEA